MSTGGLIATVLICSNIVSLLVLAAAYLLAKRLDAFKVFKYASIAEALILAIVVVFSYTALLSLVLGINVVVLISTLSFIILQYTIYPKFILKGLKLEPVNLDEKVLSSVKSTQVCLTDLSTLNAFSLDNHFSKIIVLDRKFREILTEEEFKAVVLHELFHLKSYDMAYLMSLTLTPLIIFSTGIYLLVKGYSFLRARRLIEKAGGFPLVIFLTALGILLLALVLPVYLSLFSFMRIRDHVADLYSVKVSKGSSIRESLDKAGRFSDAVSFAKSPFIVLRSIIFFSPPVFMNRKIFDRIVEFLMGSTLFVNLRKNVVKRTLSRE